MRRICPRRIEKLSVNLNIYNMHIIAFGKKDGWYIVAEAKRKGKRENEKNNTYDDIFINISFTR